MKMNIFWGKLTVVMAETKTLEIGHHVSEALILQVYSIQELDSIEEEENRKLVNRRPWRGHHATAADSSGSRTRSAQTRCHSSKHC